MLGRALAVRMYAELAAAAASAGFAIALAVAMTGPHAQQIDPLLWLGLLVLSALVWDERRLVLRTWPDTAWRPWSTRPAARRSGRVAPSQIAAVAIGGPSDGAQFTVPDAPRLPTVVLIACDADPWPSFSRYVLEPRCGATVYRFDDGVDTAEF